ncbi:hypothetical protein F4818DRAFT_128194 [Hypoxylon cercidicola]|nr:hypothetical protein F4818DRAFT_128194 [Hypoxylon cercidicola]
MVTTATVIRSNAEFASQNIQGAVCVFAGATSGIGARTLERMMTMFASATFYILGRSSSQFAIQRKVLETLNPQMNIVYIETDVSLISGIDAAYEQIAATETKVDFLCMSMGGMPLNGAVYTKEGLETCLAISYYSRMRLVSNLLPLLRESQRPRVLSVLNGGKEKHIDEQDIGLEQKWSIFAVVKHTTLMTSLAFDHLAASNDQITFMHNYPSLVKSDNLRRFNAPKSSSFLWRIVLATVKSLMGFLRFCIGMSPKESGERQAFHLTSTKYTPGSWRIGSKSDIVPVNKALKYYEDNGWAEKIWEFTEGVWDKALTAGNSSAPK